MIPVVLRAESTFALQGHGSSAVDFVLPLIGPTDAISGRAEYALTRCVVAARSGNRAARNALFLAVQPKLLHQTRRIRPWMLPATWEWSDLEQEAFLVFTQLLDAWSGEGSFTAYIFGHFSWRLRNAVRHARERERLRIARIETASLAEDDSAAAEEARILLEELAMSLPPMQREIILGRVRDGEGFGVLAHRLGVSRKTIYRYWVKIMLEIRSSFGLPIKPPAMRIPTSCRPRASKRSCRPIS